MPHLKFASLVWNTMSKKEIKKIEGVQRNATGMAKMTRLFYTKTEHQIFYKEISILTLALTEHINNLNTLKY